MPSSSIINDDFEVIDSKKRDQIRKLTGFENIPFDPQGRLTDVPIEFLESSKKIVNHLEKTTTDGYARVILIMGSAGIGKSTTIEELNKRINRNLGNFKEINGISFGGKLRHVDEITNYREFILNTINHSLTNILAKKGELQEFQKKMDNVKEEYLDAYVPEIYAGLRALKEMGYELIHYYIDELDLIESVEPQIQTNFIHFIRELGEEMVNSSIPVAISLYAVKEATAIIEKILSEAHLPANMSIVRIYLSATKEEIKKIYLHRINITERTVKGGSKVYFRTKEREAIESKFSIYHPLTEESIGLLYDYTIRDLQEAENELSTIRPLFRMFHDAFWFLLNNSSNEPITKDVVKKIYETSWWQKFIYEPFIKKRLSPIQRLTPKEKDELQTKLGNLNHPSDWSTPDIFSLFVEGLLKCINNTEKNNRVDNIDISKREDEYLTGQFIYGSTYSDLIHNSLGISIRTNIIILKNQLNKNKFLELRKNLLNKLPYSHINCWIIGTFDSDIEYLRSTMIDIPRDKGELHFLFNKEQILRILSQSVVDSRNKSRIASEAKLAKVNEFMSQLKNTIFSCGEICEDPKDTKSTYSKLLMVTLYSVGYGLTDNFYRDTVDHLQKSTVGKYDRYSELAGNGFISEVSPVEEKFNFHFPKSLLRAFTHVMKGDIQGDVDGEKYFGKHWKYLRKYLTIFNVLTKTDFEIKDIDKLDKEIKVLYEETKVLRDKISGKSIPSDVEDKWQKAKKCLEVYRSTTKLEFSDKLKITKNFEKFLIRSLELFFLENTKEFLDHVIKSIEEDVPRIEIVEKTINETFPINTILEKEIRINNSGKKDLIIRNVTTTDKNVKIKTKFPKVIKPGNDTIFTISISFSKNAEYLVMLETNDKKSPKASIKIVVSIEEVEKKSKNEKIPKTIGKPGPVNKKDNTQRENSEEQTIFEEQIYALILEAHSDKLISKATELGFSDDEIAKAILNLLKNKRIEVRNLE